MRVRPCRPDVRALALAGHPTAVIAARTGLSLGHVQKQLRGAGLNRTPGPVRTRPSHAGLERPVRSCSCVHCAGRRATQRAEDAGLGVAPGQLLPHPLDVSVRKWRCGCGRLHLDPAGCACGVVPPWRASA
jgi:hypothetical protein